MRSAMLSGPFWVLAAVSLNLVRGATIDTPSLRRDGVRTRLRVNVGSEGGADGASAHEQKAEVPANVGVLLKVPEAPANLGVLLLVPFFFWVSMSRNIPGAIIVVAWMLAGIVMNIVNKLSATAFDAPLLLVLLQLIFGVAFLVAFEGKNFKYENKSDLAAWCVVPLLFGGMLVTSLWSFRLATLSTVLVCRNILPVITYFIEHFVLGDGTCLHGADHSAVLSILTAFAGVAMYSVCNHALGDGKGASTGALILIYANSVLTCIDRLLQCTMLKKPDFSLSLSMCMFINNLGGILPLLFLAVISGEVHIWPQVIASTPAQTWVWVVMSCCCGFCLGYLGLKTQGLVTATSSLMMQNATKVLLVAVGVLVFGDPMNLGMATGCIIAVGGGAWYSYTKLPNEVKAQVPAAAVKQKSLH